MAEVDRLSNSGLYPALPIADRRSRKDGPGGQTDKLPQQPNSGAPEDEPRGAEEKEPRPSKHRIDDYA
jgi:hypothetical protein